MKPRAIHFVSAVLVGLGIGVMIYRFAILGLFWSGGAKWLFPAIATGLVAAGFSLQAKDTTSERPAMTTRIALAIVGIGAAMGVLYLIVPTLDRIPLERRELPGFSFEMPTAKPDVERLDYGTGTITWKELGGANAVVSVTWQTGTASKEDLEIGMKALGNELGGHTPTALTMTGPNGSAVDSMMVDTNKGVPLRMSVLPCGNRGIIMMSIGASGIETVHARMLTTFRCTPDAAQESVKPGTIRVAISLPGWVATEKLPGQVSLVDATDRQLLIMREISASHDKLEQVIVPLLNAFGANVTAKTAVGDRVPFSGTLAGERLEGWARRIACPTHNVLLLAMTRTVEDADAAWVAASNAGCLRPGETPPTWPDAPAEADAPAQP